MDLRPNMTMTARINKNDCWNVALSLATERDYNLVRKNLIKYSSSSGGLSPYYSQQYLEKYGYIKMDLANYNCKTLRMFADDTKYTKYRYVVSVSGHIVFIEKGLIHDSFNSDLKRVIKIMRKKSRR